MKSKIPIFDYDYRYFKLHPKYTKEELFELQDNILVIISEGSSDVEKDLNSDMDKYYVGTILSRCYHRKLIQRERLGVKTIDGKKRPTYRYYTIPNH